MVCADNTAIRECLAYPEIGHTPVEIELLGPP